MRRLKLILITLMFMFPVLAIAQAAAGAEPSLGDLLKQLIEAVTTFKSAGIQAGLAALLLVLIGTFKNSALRPFWDKLGAAKVLVAPVLSVLAALLTVHPFDLKTLWFSLLTGFLGIAVHELLDALKSAPFIGEKYKWIIKALGKLLRKPEPPKPAVLPQAPQES